MSQLNYKFISYIIGLLLLFNATAIFLTSFVSYYFNDGFFSSVLKSGVICFIFGLFVWTITQLDNYENLSEQKFEQSSKNTSTVKIEKIATLENNKNLKDDQAISENLKKIKRLEEMIKKQQATIKSLKSN